MSIFTRTEAAALSKSKDVTIPYGYTIIGDDAFKFSNIERVTIPSSVTIIGRAAFYGCGQLKSVIIPESVTTIGAYAFYRCTKLTDIILPDGIAEIGHSTFEGCERLAVINIPNSVMHIEAGAFLRCKKLADIIIPNGITEIKQSTFEGCSHLSSIIIPDSVVRIEERAFSGCSKLKVYSSKDSFARKYCGKGLFARHKWVEIDPGKIGSSYEKYIADAHTMGEKSIVGEAFHDFLSELNAVKRYIKDNKMTTQITNLDAACRQILKFVADRPESEPRIDRKVMNYYFPTALKLIRMYIDVNQQQVRVSEMDKIIENISPALEGITTALKNQLDALYQTKSIDLSSDIDVLNHMLAMDGVKKDIN